MPVTAQDFLDLCCQVDAEFHKIRVEQFMLPRIDALLSLARQEAVEAYKKEKEMEDIVVDKVASHKVIMARREALKEMDEAWMIFAREIAATRRVVSFDCVRLDSLRQEYQQPN